MPHKKIASLYSSQLVLLPLYAYLRMIARIGSLSAKTCHSAIFPSFTTASHAAGVFQKSSFLTWPGSISRARRS